ncbi:MAG TPA: MFS transporter, partial [Gemmatimonadales bacterium]|nr:MFS transporter [Gemmatimonadales bacterium]
MAQTLNAEKQTAQEQSVEAGATSRRLWVLGLVFMALVFDGYDLVVYGAVLPTLFKDPSQLGQLTPELAGALGSYALVGVLIGALITGTLSDRIGRRKVVLGALVWFSLGMGLSAMATNATFFGIMRFVTGIGVGALVATVGAVAAEFAPPGKKNLYVGVAYCGVPLGAAMAALLSLLLLGPIGWRGLFLIGALPLVTLLPLALIRLPESPLWLAAKGRMADA